LVPASIRAIQVGIAEADTVRAVSRVWGALVCYFCYGVKKINTLCLWYETNAPFYMTCSQLSNCQYTNQKQMLAGVLFAFTVVLKIMIKARMARMIRGVL